MLAHDLEATQGKGRGLVARDIRRPVKHSMPCTSLPSQSDGHQWLRSLRDRYYSYKNFIIYR